MQKLSYSSDFSSPAALQGKAIITYSAFGVRVGLETTPRLLERVPFPLIAGGIADKSGRADTVFALSETQSDSGTRTYGVSGADGIIAVETSIENAVQCLKRQAEEFVAEAARDFVFVHAGAVAWRGKAILIPGRTFSGKSTLVMSLVRAGATYLSDEYAVIDGKGLVHPFARAPRLRGEVGQELAAGSGLTFVNNQEIRAIPAGLVLKTAYQADATWRPVSLTGGEALLALLENTVAVRSQIELTITVLKKLMLSARGVKTARPEAEALASQILQLADTCPG